MYIILKFKSIFIINNDTINTLYNQKKIILLLTIIAAFYKI